MTSKNLIGIGQGESCAPNGNQSGCGLAVGAPGRLQVLLRMPVSNPPLWVFLALAIFPPLRGNLWGCWMGAPAAAAVLAKSDVFFPVAEPPLHLD